MIGLVILKDVKHSKIYSLQLKIIQATQNGKPPLVIHHRSMISGKFDNDMIVITKLHCLIAVECVSQEQKKSPA